ncbi:efflux RND transporter periplasmic adaptor subunit [Aminobacter sp. AP02]|uniref:efflux RND transporter periplasmic adaptor subunit n=1 Tax=Aminobacter sp. AP02 TaxID=2135737 RepID=UPI000D6CC8B2|nr:efflux RND transporter periplasmic adaptor subunit [Aminobacter sp. AP02]PWK72874.1 HlyD family secretion protein [Aminobacter sp. AP02]
MDQLVNRAEQAGAPSIEAALGLDGKGRATRRRKNWLWLLLALVAAACAYAAYSWLAAPSEKITYTTHPAEIGDLIVQVSATGNLQPLTQVDISSELSGVVRSVAVVENQHVKKGDVLAALDTTRLSAQIERAQASAKAAAAKVEDTRTTLSETARTLTRAQELTRRGMATTQALEAATAERDRAQSALDMAEANLAIAEADLKLQQADLAKSTIYAPIDGVVLTRSVNPGQTVASSMQAPVLFVLAADLSQMELKAAVDEADIGSVAKEQNARFTVDAFPNRSFDATIRDIAYASVTTDGVVTYNAWLDVENDELLLRPGMTATVSIVTRDAKGVLTVPATAFRYRPTPTARNSGFSLQNLFLGRPNRGPTDRSRPTSTPADGSRTLYVLRNGAPVAVRVKTGSTDGDRTEITSGLSAGDAVITASSSAKAN